MRPLSPVRRPSWRHRPRQGLLDDSIGRARGAAKCGSLADRQGCAPHCPTSPRFSFVASDHWAVDPFVATESLPHPALASLPTRGTRQAEPPQRPSQSLCESLPSSQTRQEGSYCWGSYLTGVVLAVEQNRAPDPVGGAFTTLDEQCLCWTTSLTRSGNLLKRAFRANLAAAFPGSSGHTCMGTIQEVL